MDNAILDVRLTNLEKVNDGLSKANLLIANYGKNKKKFNIPKEVFCDAIPSLLGAPVVAHFFDDGNLGGHEDDLLRVNGKLRKTGKTYAYGFVDYVNEPTWVIENDKEWLSATVYIFTSRFPESGKILTSNQSMEVSLTIKDVDDEGYANVERMKFYAVCALNPKGILPTFLGSKFERFSMDDISKDVEEMKEEFMKEEFILNGEMMRKAMMAMYEKYGMKYMTYGMDDKYMYVMDTEKEMAKMMIPYMMEDDMMAMDYDKMMPMDYEEKEMAIKAVMGMLYEKMMEMKKENMGMMENYSTKEKELEVANDKIKEFSKLVDKEDEALKRVVELTASLEENKATIESLKTENEKFSTELKKSEDERKIAEAKGILEKEDFSILTEEDKTELMNDVVEVDIETFTMRVKSKTLDKVLAYNIANTKEPFKFSRMGSPTIVTDKVDDKDSDAFDRLKNKK